MKETLLIAIISSSALMVLITALWQSLWYKEKDKKKLIHQQLENEQIESEMKFNLNRELNVLIDEKLALLHEIINVKGSLEEMTIKYNKCKKKYSEDLQLRDTRIEELEKIIKNNNKK